MNQELEKLVDYALVDGYITDKEKQVLFKKAQSQGFDTDELEMILEGKLFEINKSSKPKVNKCPSCGEIMSGLSKVCSACDYVINSDTVEDTENVNDALRRLEESVYALKAMPQPGVSSIINSVILIIITSGLCIIYKKLIKKEALFDRFAVVNEKIIAVTDMQVRSLQTKYGADEKISKYVNDLVTERDGIIRKRKKSDAISALATFVIIGVVIYLFITIADAVPNSKAKTEIEPESAESITKRHINAGNIGAAKLSVVNMENGIEKNDFIVTIRDLEIDSLTKAGNYDAALGLARLIKNTDDISLEMEHKIDAIVEKQVDELVVKKEFSLAKEKAAIATYPKNNYFLTSIKVAEYLDKNAKNDIKTSGQARKKNKK